MINLLRRLTATTTFRPRVRVIEAVGFGILLVGLYLLWRPLPFIVLGAAVVAYAQIMRR